MRHHSKKATTTTTTKNSDSKQRDVDVSHDDGVDVEFETNTCSRSKILPDEKKRLNFPKIPTVKT